MTELKPCPFCGNEALIWQGVEYSSYRVACKSQYECAGQVGPYDTEEEAINAWNRREGETK